MRQLVQLASLLSSIAAALAAAALVCIVLLVIAEIVSRSIFNSSILFAVEWATYMQAALILCGAGYTLRTGGHIRVSLSFELLPAKITRGIDLVATAIAIWISGFLAYAMTDLAFDALIDRTLSAWPSQTPLFIPQLAAAVGAVALFVELLGRLLSLLAGIDVTETNVTRQAE
jgi:TRAP-type C4-dicarboxylate transport system permease small subunit